MLERINADACSSISQIMSIQNLPNELIYHILSQVDDKFVGYRCLSRQSSLASLARVSKRFVDPVRTCLYDKPLRGLKIPSWDAAIKLIDSLTMNGRNLGKTVKSLEGLGHWFNFLRHSEPGSKLPYQARRCTPAFSWYLQILRICSRTHQVDIVFETPSELEKVLKAIRRAAPITLKAVVFVGLKSLGVPRKVNPTFGSVLAALQAVELSDIDDIYLEDVSFDSITRPSRPSMPHLLSHVIVGGERSVSLSNCIRALPSDASELVTLSLTTSSTYPDSNLLPILEHLGEKLQTLLLFFASSFGCLPSLSKYPLPPQHFVFPLEPFTKFSQLNSLTLTGFVGPSLNLLSSLATTCPLLQKIDFRKSFWIPNEPNNEVSRTISYLNSIFQEEEVVRELNKLKNLGYLHLGYLPTTEIGDYKKLEKEMRDRGVWFYWQPCRTEGIRCDYCGGYHTDDEED
ncbi:hypothetical protein JCM5350_003422 [Sporobolomyces pararoseus]